MDQRHSKTMLSVVAVICVIVPIIVTLFDMTVGVVLLFFGMLVTGRAVFIVRDAQREAHNNPYARTRAEAGRTIFVQLVDDHGVNLDPAVARAKLDEAQQLAGPRDTVIGVHRVVA